MPNLFTGNNLPDQIQGFLSLIPGTRQNRDWRDQSSQERQVAIQSAKAQRSGLEQQNQLFELAKTNPQLNAALNDALAKHLGLGLTQAQTGHIQAQTGLTGAETAGKLEENKLIGPRFELDKSMNEAQRGHLAAQSGLASAQQQALQQGQGIKGKEQEYLSQMGIPSMDVYEALMRQLQAGQATQAHLQGTKIAAAPHLLQGLMPEMVPGPPDAKGRSTMTTRQNPAVPELLKMFGIDMPQPTQDNTMKNAVMNMLQQHTTGTGTPAASTSNSPAGAVSPQAAQSNYRMPQGVSGTVSSKFAQASPFQQTPWAFTQGEEEAPQGQLMQSMLNSPTSQDLQKVLQLIKALQGQ